MNYFKLYADFLKKKLKIKKPIKVVFDCSNGVTGIILKELFRKSHVTCHMSHVIPILLNDNPDGNFPAHEPNPSKLEVTEQLQKEVKRQKADLGVIFDGDGDRAFFIDNLGRRIDSNETAYILMKQFKPPYVISVIAGRRLRENKRVFVSRVGHFFFKKLMRKKNASLGLEQSGHYYFRDFFYCDCGILSAIKIINFVSGLDTDLASWLDKLPKYYRSGEINFEVKNKEEILKKIEEVYKNQKTGISKMDGLTLEFKWGWLNLRPSNTEPLLRLNIEAESKKILDEKLKEIKKIILM